MTQYLGTAKISVNGKLLDTEPNAKLNLGGTERVVREGAVKVGYSEKRKASMLECELGVTRDTPIEEIRNLVNATIHFEADTGQRYLVKGAFTTNPLEITAGDGGKVPLKMAGEPAEPA